MSIFQKFFSVQEWISASLCLIQKRQKGWVGISGGNTPIPLYEKIDFPLKTFLVDERVVPLEHEDSNARTILPFFPALVHFETEKQAETALFLYHTFLETIEPDLIILGSGQDFHTASIFPEDQNLWNTKNLCDQNHKSFSVPDYTKIQPGRNELQEIKTTAHRFSLSRHMILRAKTLLLLLRGPEKQNIFQTLQTMNTSDPSKPSSLILEHPDAFVFFLEKNP